MRWRPKMEYWLDSVAELLKTLLRLTPADAAFGVPAVRTFGAVMRVLVVWRMPWADSRISRAAQTDLPNSLNEAPQASGKSIK